MQETLVWLLGQEGPLEKGWLPTPVFLGFPGGSAGKESACNAGDLGLIPGLGRSPREGSSYPLQYSGLENSMDCIIHGVAKSWTRLSDFHFHFSFGQKQFWWNNGVKAWSRFKRNQRKVIGDSKYRQFFLGTLLQRERKRKEAVANKELNEVFLWLSLCHRLPWRLRR